MAIRFGSKLIDMAKKREKPSTHFVKGMFRDSSPLLQGEGTYFYALNATDRSVLKEMGYRYFEHSNALDTYIGNSFIIGSVYMVDNRVCLITTDGKGDDKIGIYDEINKTFKVILNMDMGLKPEYQIETLFRMKRGCEETIYFTDNLNPVRYFNLSRPELIQNYEGLYEVERLNLFEYTSKIPRFSGLKVVTGGQIPAGKIFVGIQYLDDDLNITAPILLSQGVKIYHDSLSKNYFDIEGSTGIQDVQYLNYPMTSKAIEVTLTNIDKNYSFYRLVFLKYTSGTGELSGIDYTNDISTLTPTFTYTGNNVHGKMSLEEFQTYVPFYSVAKNILEIDNTLGLSNLKGPKIDYCNLQKYASKIESNLAVRKVILNDINDRFSPKNPVGDMWLMPGEIYSYGIQFIF